MKITLPNLQRFCVQALEFHGIPQGDSATVAEALVMTDSWGIHSHGTKNLRCYLRRVTGGGLKNIAQPVVVREGPAWAVVNADSGIAMIGSTFAMKRAIEKARTSGIAYVGLMNSCHFGAAGYYAWLAAREGLVGIAVCNDTPTVAVPGSRTAVMGSNPFAFSAPIPGGDPLLFDAATSTVAGGKVFAAAVQGRKVPEGWIVDSEGKPTTDPTLFPQAAALTPVGGHKGYGIALWVELLSAVLPGAAVAAQVCSWSFEDPARSTGHGAAFLALDPAILAGTAEYNSRISELISQIRTAPLAGGVERILLPGEMEWARRRQALESGVALPPEAAEPLRLLSKETGIALEEVV